MKNFHDWSKQNHPQKINEFFGGSLMNRPQTGQMQRMMNLSTDAAAELKGNENQANLRKVGWVLSTIQKMFGQNPDMINYLIRSLMGMRKELMKNNELSDNMDISKNPQAR